MSTTERPEEGHVDDEELLHELRGVIAQVDPVPARVVEAAGAAFTTRALDEELAALVADSTTGLGGLARVRAELVTRLLSFETEDGVGVELEIVSTGTTFDAQGQVVGELQGDIVVEHAGGVEHLAAGEVGRFEVRGLPVGRVRLRWHTAAGRRTTTVWVDV